MGLHGGNGRHWAGCAVQRHVGWPYGIICPVVVTLAGVYLGIQHRLWAQRILLMLLLLLLQLRQWVGLVVRAQTAAPVLASTTNGHPWEGGQYLRS